MGPLHGFFFPTNWQNTTRNLQIYDWIYDSFLIIIMTCDLLQCLVVLDKSHKILITKKKRGTKLQRQLHKDATYMNYFIHPNQVTWHCHFAIDFMTKKCSNIIYICLNYYYFNNKIVILYIFTVFLFSLNSTYTMLTCVVT